jgi:hypothetical protein
VNKLELQQLEGAGTRSVVVGKHHQGRRRSREKGTAGITYIRMNQYLRKNMNVGVTDG